MKAKKLLKIENGVIVILVSIIVLLATALYLDLTSEHTSSTVVRSTFAQCEIRGNKGVCVKWSVK